VAGALTPGPGPKVTAAAAPHGALRLAVVVRPGDALGFRLGGARVEEVEAGAEAQAFRALLAEPDLGVVAVEEEVLAQVPPRVLRRARERGVPVVLPFALPRRWGDEGKGRAYVAALIRRAVGYGVKLGGEGGR
jgi:V/A-type H+-transporting ATPase subunit F